MARRGAHHELNDWLDHHGYRHEHATKTSAHPYAVSSRMSHARKGATKAETIAAIRATGATVKYRDGEWLVNVPGGSERTAYYTSDAEDALGTARTMMARQGATHSHARKSDSSDRLFIGTFPTGIRYADKQRERGGDYLPLAFLPYRTLQLEWDRRAPVALGLREQIERHADSIRARRGEEYPISSSGQTVKLGHARVADSGQKFKVGDIVRRTGAAMRSMGVVSGPINGRVEGYSGRWPLIRWSDMSDSEEPMAQAEAGLELDKRAMARRGHARTVESPTGRDVFAAKERGHHITTHGRQTLGADQFALPPGPEEKRRGIKGRLPIDTLKRARNALARAAQMKKRGHLSAAQLATVRRKVHAAWPSIDVET